MARPFRFMAAFREITSHARLEADARRIEAMGYTDACTFDHLPQLAPIPILTAIAAATSSLRVSPLVLNNDLRHPAVLAQDLATLDVLSDGRVDIGLGAGWNEPEYRAIDLRFDRPGVRIERMLEAITVMRGLFGDGPFSFEGTHYTIRAMDGHPKPVQRPHPPFLIGGTRERVLRIAAREGDIVGFDLRQDRESLADGFAEGMDRRTSWARDEAGDRFDRLDLNVLRVMGPISITPNAKAAAQRVADDYRASTGADVTAEDILESPYSLIGTIPSLAEKLRAARDRWGINSYEVGGLDEPGFDDLAPLVEQLAGT